MTSEQFTKLTEELGPLLEKYGASTGEMFTIMVADPTDGHVIIYGTVSVARMMDTEKALKRVMRKVLEERPKLMEGILPPELTDLLTMLKRQVMPNAGKEGNA